MGFVIGILTFVMVVDCLALILLVLIQLPKKEAGMGLAFGGAATDALFGAGSGNVLTKVTKYAATTFFVLAVVLSLMQRVYHTRTTSVFEQKLQQSSPAPGIPTSPGEAPAVPTTTPQPPATKSAAVSSTNTLRVVSPPVEDTNLPIAIPVTPPTTTPAKK
jgi:preprotein translocase subunit SecG